MLYMTVLWKCTALCLLVGDEEASSETEKIS